ncbi:hypothetical protein Tco_0739337, partial [Tanacetum coccineum]
FAQILDIPCEGACVFTDKWSLDELAYGVPTDGTYQTNPPSPDDIISCQPPHKKTTSPTTTSSSRTPPNAHQKTAITNQTSRGQENTSSSFQSKLQISPPSSNEPTSPQPLNSLLDNILDVPPRPSNPQPLQTCSGSLSSSEAYSDGGVIGLAISLPLYLVDALDLVEDDFLMVVHMVCEVLVLDNTDLDMVEQQQQVLMDLHSWLFSQYGFH